MMSELQHRDLEKNDGVKDLERSDDDRVRRGGGAMT